MTGNQGDLLPDTALEPRTGRPQRERKNVRRIGQIAVQLTNRFGRQGICRLLFRARNKEFQAKNFHLAATHSQAKERSRDNGLERLRHAHFQRRT